MSGPDRKVKPVSAVAQPESDHRQAVSNTDAGMQSDSVVGKFKFK